MSQRLQEPRNKAKRLVILWILWISQHYKQQEAMESFAFPDKAERVVLMVGLSISDMANYNDKML